MNNEALRKEIYEELHSQYESKLRNAKKQKSQLEEELESASEKWRAERRRLNSEIDRLETALADNRDARRKTGDTKSSRPETPDVAKLQAASDERLRKAAQEWEGERAKLEAEISRLQRGVAELLERANNPMRAGQAVRDLLEGKLEEALKTKRQAEETLLDAKKQWEQEKLKLAGEMIKLRRSIGQGPAEKDKVPEEDRSKVKELEKQLADAQRKRQELETDFEKGRSQSLQATEAQSAEIQRLTAQLNEIRNAAAKEYAELTGRERREHELNRGALERDLQQARARIQELEASVEKGLVEILQTREAQSAEIHRLTTQFESNRETAAKNYGEQIEREQRENARNREALERDLQKTQKEVELLKGTQAADVDRQAVQLEESQKAHAKIRQLEQRIAEDRATAAKEYGDRIERERQENARARETLERNLQIAQSEIDLLKGAQAADLERQASQLEESQKAHARIRELERRIAEESDSVSKEYAEHMERERQENATARETLERQLQKAQKEVDLLRGTQAADLERQASQLEESQKAHARIRELERHIAEESDSAAKEYADRMERERQENATASEALERELQKAQKEIELLKGAQSADLERQASQLEESRKAHTRIQDLERRIAVSRDSAGKETAALLEKQIAESARARQSLERDLQKAQQETVQLKEKQAEELRLVMVRLEESQTEIQLLARQLEETRGAVSAEVVEQLRRQYDERLQEMILEKTQLSEQLNNASVLLEAERSRFAAAAAAQSEAKPAKETTSGATIDPEALDAEFARVEALIADISKLIDDPSTELSLVIRKNVERAGLDAYLKGILFSLGRSQGL